VSRSNIPALNAVSMLSSVVREKRGVKEGISLESAQIKMRLSDPMKSLRKTRSSRA
jgi:hypothetical protein